MTGRVSIKEAAEILGVSRKAIERRIHSGELVATKNGRSYIIDLPDDYEIRPMDRTTRDSVATKVQLAAALAELGAVKSERDRLVQQLEDASRHISELTATVFQLSQQKALPAPSKRPWWKFWERDEEPQKEV